MERRNWARGGSGGGSNTELSVEYLSGEVREARTKKAGWLVVVALACSKLNLHSTLLPEFERAGGRVCMREGFTDSGYYEGRGHGPYAPSCSYASPAWLLNCVAHSPCRFPTSDAVDYRAIPISLVSGVFAVVFPVQLEVPSARPRTYTRP